MDGWTKVGEILACSACTAKIAEVAEKAVLTAIGSKPDTSKLAALLGNEPEEVKPRLIVGQDERRFCRDCLHLIKHPFLTRCNLHQKEVNPMADCPDYQPRPPK